MKFKKYKILSNNNLYNLEDNVNDYIAKGCKPLGGVSISIIDSKVTYIQTIIVDDDSNSSLGEFNAEPEFFREARRLAVSNKFEAVKFLMEKSGIGLSEAKNWIDNNC